MAVQELQGVAPSHLINASQDKNTGSAEAVQAGKPAASAPEQPGAEAARKSAAEHEKQVAAAAQQLNDYMKQHSIGLRFSIDSDTHEIIVKVVNKQTGKMIRQIPSEEALKIAKSFETKDIETLQGLIIRKQA